CVFWQMPSILHGVGLQAQSPPVDRLMTTWRITTLSCTLAYGSNLLKERLQLKNPSATVHCVARTINWFLDHKGLASDRCPGDEVWGVVWRMNVSDLESLDSQENGHRSVQSGGVIGEDKGQDLNCRTYIMNSCVYASPSPQYLKVIVMGAEQNGLPKDYQEKLRAIKTNMYEGPLPMMAELERARRRAKEKVNHRSNDA
uniref:Gamma-glutamylcyclotransferase n=1 Tax=Astatotilapia calliptera TaxID=8154 RepID=A0A3P8NT01_ASTCA